MWLLSFQKEQMKTIHPAISISNVKNLAIAFSAGVDSVAIAHYCMKWKPTLIHFNHKLRPQNDVMEAKALEFAEEFGLKIIVHSRKNSFSNSSFEAEARQMRFDAFRESFSDANIIVCHHLNDAVENYLWNCMRGHDTHDCIPIRTALSDRINLIRPFMTTSKQELIEYASEHNLGKFVVEDETNTDQSINRNWIRHGLIPQIKDRMGIDTVVKKKVLKQYGIQS